MTGLFETLSRRFSAPPAILPRRRLRFEGASGAAALHDRSQEQAAYWPPPGTRPGASPSGDRQDAPATRPRDPTQPAQSRVIGGIAPAADIALAPRMPQEGPAHDRGALPPATNSRSAQRSLYAPAATGHGAVSGPISGGTPSAGTEPAPAPRTAAVNPDWQHSAMPPVAHATSQPSPQPVATVVEVARAIPSSPGTALSPHTGATAPADQATRSVPVPDAAAPDPGPPRVEIHIGRIEVAAAKPAPGPAAPARAAPATASATTSAGRSPSAPGRRGLTDYLGWKR